MRDRDFYPKRLQKQASPSRLADLNGRRKPGNPVNMAATKPPRPRFSVGDHFEFEGTIWRIIYMYRLVSEPGIWQHCLEEQRGLTGNAAALAAGFTAIGAGATTPRIVYEAFGRWEDANAYFSDIYRMGDSTTKTTQELLSMKRV